MPPNISMALPLSRLRRFTSRLRVRFPRRLAGQESPGCSLRAARHGVGTVGRVATRDPQILASACEHLLRVATGAAGQQPWSMVRRAAGVVSGIGTEP